MNWDVATESDVLAKLRDVIKRGGGITVSPKWLLRILQERRLLAMMAADTPQFDNPLVAFKAQNIRDRILGDNTSKQEKAG